jgi:hypothetical protein
MALVVRDQPQIPADNKVQHALIGFRMCEEIFAAGVLSDLCMQRCLKLIGCNAWALSAKNMRRDSEDKKKKVYDANVVHVPVSSPNVQRKKFIVRSAFPPVEMLSTRNL